MVVGVAPETLRTYEKLGLLIPQRSNTGQRIYTASDLDRAREIVQTRLSTRYRGLRTGSSR